MDQFAESCGVEGAALLLDCRSLDWRAIPLPTDLALVVCHTGSPRHLDGSEYNLRRSQCEAAVAALATIDPPIRSLRDVTPEILVAAGRPARPGRLPARASTSSPRTRASRRPWRPSAAGDLAAVGRLFAASHASLRDRFEVSSPELDAMVEIAAGGPGRRRRADDRRRVRWLHGQPRPPRRHRRARAPPSSATTRRGPASRRRSSRSARRRAPAGSAESRSPPTHRSLPPVCSPACTRPLRRAQTRVTSRFGTSGILSAGPIRLAAWSPSSSMSAARPAARPATAAATDRPPSAGSRSSSSRSWPGSAPSAPSRSVGVYARSAIRRPDRRPRR